MWFQSISITTLFQREQYLRCQQRRPQHRWWVCSLVRMVEMFCRLWCWCCHKRTNLYQTCTQGKRNRLLRQRTRLWIKTWEFYPQLLLTIFENNTVVETDFWAKNTRTRQILIFWIFVWNFFQKIWTTWWRSREVSVADFFTISEVSFFVAYTTLRRCSCRGMK